MQNQKIIQVGAEAVIIHENNSVIKRRLKKSYRIPEIDEKVRKLRTRSEAKLLEKASKIIDVPKIIKIDEIKKEIVLEFIEGKKLSDALDNFPLKMQKETCEIIGKNLAQLHSSNIIHGDLTTSNMILVDNLKDNSSENTLKNISKNKIDKLPIKKEVISLTKKKGDKNFKIFFIDFGLGFISNKIEDKAVDIHLLKQALEAKHFKNWEVLFEKVVEGYKKYSEHKKVLEQLKKVEQRGRYKEKY